MARQLLSFAESEWVVIRPGRARSELRCVRPDPGICEGRGHVSAASSSREGQEFVMRVPWGRRPDDDAVILNPDLLVA